MEDRIALYPIPGVAHECDDEPFDLSVLPAPIVPGVTVEDVSSLLSEDAFNWLKGEMGRYKVQAMQAVRYAIVYRYQPGQIDVRGEADRKAEALVWNLAACLRLIRPMRQRASFIRGVVQPDGKLQVGHFEHPSDLMEVPPVQKGFVLLNRDLAHFQKVACDFLGAMEGEFWKFRMSVQLHEAGHFAHLYWKARFSLWCSAVEALFTSKTKGHNGSLVAKERIKWFLGPKTSIYAPGDFSSLEVQRNIPIEDVIDDLYELRNCVAHGDKSPDRFFEEARISFGESVMEVQVLHEAISFIIRASLLRILDERLMNHFANGPASEAYFGAEGLTSPVLRAQMRIRSTKQGEENLPPNQSNRRRLTDMATQRKIERDTRIFARDGFQCVYCGFLGNTFETWRYLTIDHFHPRAKGGSYDDEENLVTACMDCNSIKSGEEFATVQEAKAKFEAQYLPIERRDFEKHFAPLIAKGRARSAD